MAALTAVYVSGGGRAISPLPDGPLRKEIWRIPAGSIADTALITPRYPGKVVAAHASLCDSNLTTADPGTATTVTFTLRVAIVQTVDAVVWIAE